VTTAIATHTLSIVRGRPHLDGRPLPPDARVELTAWELSQLILECIADFSWNVVRARQRGNIGYDGRVDVGLPTPAHVYDEVDFEWSDIGLRH